MRMRLLLCGLLVASSVSPVWAGEEERDYRCNAVSLEDRPKLGGGSDYGYAPYQKRHNIYNRNHRDIFASGYIAGNHFYVGFTRNVCRHLWRFRQGLHQRWRVRAFDAVYSYGKLKRAQRCTSELMGRRDLDIQGTDVDVWRNKHEVMLKRNTERRRDIITRACPTVNIRFTEGEVGPG